MNITTGDATETPFMAGRSSRERWFDETATEVAHFRFVFLHRIAPFSKRGV